MDLPKQATRGAAVVALGVAALWTWLAESGKRLDPAGRALEYDAHVVAAWCVAVLAAAAWRPAWRWASWTAAAALVSAGALTVTTLDLVLAPLAAGSAIVAVSLVPGLWAHARRRGWTKRLGMETHPLRWATAVVALLAALVANVAGALWAQLEPQTRWGPWTYVALSWLTSALAACAWIRPPWRTTGLLLGGVASAAWFVAMLPYGFILNLAGHALAAMFFMATAWDERGRPGVTRNTLSESSSPRS